MVVFKVLTHLNLLTVDGLLFTVDLLASPLTIDTVRQSIASATAKRMISIRLISGAKLHDFMQ